MNPVLISKILLSKWLWGSLILAAILIGTYQSGYSNAKEKYDQRVALETARLALTVKEQELQVANENKQQTEKQLAVEKNNTKVVTKYQTQKETVIKEVPKIEKQIETIYVDKPVEYLDPRIVRMHDDFVCKNQVSSDKVSTNGSSCRVANTSGKSSTSRITAEQFTKKVMQNYTAGVQNQNKLQALQEVVKGQASAVAGTIKE